VNFVDYSQFNAFQKCPYYWYERYCRGYIRKYDGGQRDDAMAIGSVVHSGLENYYLHNTPTPNQDVLEENNLTPDAGWLAQQMINGYVLTYPKEAWTLMGVEEPLIYKTFTPVPLLAKVDAFFRVEEPMSIPGGPDGEEIYLRPGLWIQEYKTKADGRRDLWLQRWAVDMQADFQMLALDAAYPASERKGDNEEICGLLVNVIEKPRQSTPRRKCKGCKETYDYMSYLNTVDGWACPVCGFVQQLTPLKIDTPREATYFRHKVERSPEQLQVSRRLISHVAERMLYMEQRPNMGSEVYNKSQCLHSIYGPCDYFNNHTYGLDVSEDNQLEKRETLHYAGYVNITT